MKALEVGLVAEVGRQREIGHKAFIRVLQRVRQGYLWTVVEIGHGLCLSGETIWGAASYSKLPEGF